MNQRQYSTLCTARRLAAPPVTRLALLAFARGLTPAHLAAASGVPVAVVSELIAGGDGAANSEIAPFVALARALGLPVAVLLSADPCPCCLSTERTLTGACPVCEVVA